MKMGQFAHEFLTDLSNKIGKLNPLKDQTSNNKATKKLPLI